VNRTAVIVPAPCISGWKFEDGKRMSLACDGARAGLHPTFVWRRGERGRVVDCAREAKDRPSVDESLAARRRFVHVIERDRKTGEIRVKPGREPHVEAFRTWVQNDVERRYHLAEMKNLAASPSGAAPRGRAMSPASTIPSRAKPAAAAGGPPRKPEAPPSAYRMRISLRLSDARSVVSR
jgi:hypothetical protein